MTTATIAVKGSASDEVPADYAVVHFGHEFRTPERTEALAGGNSFIAHLREVTAQLGAGVRETTVHSFRVDEAFNHVDHVREHAGWAADIGGQVVVEAGTVRVTIAELIKLGVRTHQLTWHLDEDTRLAAHRAVRRQAVADAREAANDFALALGAQLGRLITLADPGLLGGGAIANGPIRSAAHMASATSGTSSTSWDGYVDVDSAMITISANVEASYEVTLP